MKRINNSVTSVMDATFEMIVNVGNMASFISRMDLPRYVGLYHRLLQIYREQVKTLTVQRI